MAHTNVNAGHSVNCRGMSSQWLDEVTEDRLVVAAAKKYLKAGGDTVSDSTSSEKTSKADLAFIVNAANNSGASRFVSVHFNASNGAGTGVEVWYYTGNETTKALAAKMSAALAKLMGIKDRGAKPTTSLYVIKNTKLPAILIETCFGDNESDVKAYRKVGPDAVGKCVAEVLLGKSVSTQTTSGTTGQTTNSSTQTTNTTSSASTSTAKTGTGFGGTYKCMVGTLNVRDAPSLSGNVVTHYSKGQTVVLDDWYKIADGWVWGRYTGASSGKYRYVAVGKPTGAPDASDYLIKV